MNLVMPLSMAGSLISEQKQVHGIERLGSHVS